MGFGLIINKTFISPFSTDNWGRIFERISKIPSRLLLAHLHTGAEILSKLKISPKVSSQQAVSLQRRLNDSSTFESDVVKSQPMPWSKIRHQLLLNDNFKIFQKNFIFYFSYYYYYFLSFPPFYEKKTDARRGVDGKPKEHAAPNHGYRSTSPH